MENLTNWCVYMHENRVNGKKYIGITSQKPTKRWQNGHGYTDCPRFYRAIQKHGWDAFRHDLLFTDLRQEQAERLEKELIAKYRTQDARFGYNISAGGGEINHGRPLSDEHKGKIRAANIGRTLNSETRRRISEAKRGKCTGAEHHNSKPVKCLETGVVYSAAAEAERLTGAQRDNIAACCRGSRKTAGGLHWEYVEAVSAT